jgi:hypothetical protein
MTCMGDMRNVYKILVLKDKKLLRKYRCTWEYYMKAIPIRGLFWAKE